MKPQEALVLAAEVIHNRDLPSLAAALKNAAAELKALGEVKETLFVCARAASPGKLFVEAIALTAEILATGKRYQMRVGAPYPRVGEFITEHDVTKSIDVVRSLGEHEQPPSETELRLAEAAYSASLHNDPYRLRFEFIGPADTRKWVGVARAVLACRQEQEPSDKWFAMVWAKHGGGAVFHEKMVAAMLEAYRAPPSARAEEHE